jgi:hypothetical protein
MRLLLALLLFTTCGLAAFAQAPFPAAPAPEAAWGGYALPAQVPYQPSLDGLPMIPPPDPTSPLWQGYPPAVDENGQAIVLDGTEPFGPPVPLPSGVPEGSGYSITSEPDLKKSLIPMGARNGFFQKAKFTATYLPQLDYTSLGWTDLRTEVVTALPFFTRENPIIITPSYELHFLNRPYNIFLPPRLHDAAIDFHIFRVYDNHWIADFAVTPGIFSDDHSFDSSEALRINGRAIGVYAPTIDLKYALGVTYLDGGWSKVVPVAGVIWTPTDDVEYQLLFPTPRVSWRLNGLSAAPGSDERWVYVGLEYGNSAWAFEQPDGTPDVLASRDYRLVFGAERRVAGGVSHRIEIGYVFNRDIKVASISGDDISLDDTLLLRAGISY